MICSEVTPLLDSMLDGELDSERITEVKEHLDECTECSSVWDELNLLQQRVRGFLGTIHVSESVRAKIQNQLSAPSQSFASDYQPQPKVDKPSVQPPHYPAYQPSVYKPPEVPVYRPHSTPFKYTANPVSEQTVAIAATPVPLSSGNTPSFRPRTIVCERHELIRFGLKRVVSERVTVIGEADDGMMAMDLIRRLQPDLVILDVDLDILNGVEICRRLRDELPNSNALILTDSYHATKYHNQLMRAGARGFCLKKLGPRTLFEAIEQTSRGLPYCDPKIAQLVKQSSASSTPNSNLTEREIEVLIRLDLRNKEIAEELDMKLRTVEKHIECILAKLKVPTRTAAALKAVQQGYTLLPKMPGRDPVSGSTHEHIVAELQAELAIANEHLKALFRQNSLLSDALTDRL